jgi:hypothetical protein
LIALVIVMIFLVTQAAQAFRLMFTAGKPAPRQDRPESHAQPQQAVDPAEPPQSNRTTQPTLVRIPALRNFDLLEPSNRAPEVILDLEPPVPRALTFADYPAMIGAPRFKGPKHPRNALVRIIEAPVRSVKFIAGKIRDAIDVER